MNKYKYLKIILATAILLLTVWYINKNWQDFLIIKNIDLPTAMILFLATSINTLIYAFFMDLAFNKNGVKIGLVKWFALSNINRFANHLLLRSGLLIRGQYLKTKYNVSYRDFILIIYYFTFLSLLSSSLLGALALIINYLINNYFSYPLFGLFIVVVIGSGLGIILPRVNILTKLKQFLKIDVNNFKITVSKKFLLMGLGLSALIVLFNSFKIWYIFYKLYEGIDFYSAIIYAAIGVLAGVISITPASIGIKESAIAYSAQLSQGSFSSAAVVASVDRIAIIFTIFIWSALALWPLFKKNKND